MHFCKKYELDQSRTHLLLSELESVQKNTRFAITWKEIKEISESQKKKRLAKFGSEPNHLALGMIVKYIYCDKELVKLLQISKKVNERLRRPIYKQALLLSQPERLYIKRNGIWRCLLNLNHNDRDYDAFKQKVLNDHTLIKNVEEVIVLDVQRSVHNMQGVDPQELTNVLKTYAYFNQEIEYCQGMNFIVGFLLMVFRDEELAFKALNELVERFNMADLFNSDLPRLKLFFYQLDRLISIVEPDLHAHFKDEMINASYFASAWFITIFTNSMKKPPSNLQAENSEPMPTVCENLLQLWDYFLVSGWKVVLKMGLFVLAHDAGTLMQQSFEEMLHIVSEKPKILLCTHGVKIRPPQRKEDDGKPTTLYKTLKETF